MERLLNRIIWLYNQELSDLQIGYEYNSNRLTLIDDLVNIINYVDKVYLSKDELIKIIQSYGEL